MAEKPKVTPGYRLDRDERGVTAREREVLALLKDGKSYTEIGAQLGLSKQRVGTLVNGLVKKGVLVRVANGKFAEVIDRG